MDFSDDNSTRLRLELALEASGLVDWDFDYEKNTAHRGLRHDLLYGYKEMLPKWNFDDFFHHVLPEFHEMVAKEFENVAITGQIECRFKIRKVGGEIRWLYLVGKGKRNSEGKVIRVAGILKDITEEKHAEERYIVQNQNIRSLFEKSREFFCVIGGPQFVYEYVNPSHVALFNGRDMTGLSVVEAQPELEGTSFIDDLNAVLGTGMTFHYSEAPVMIGERLRYLDMIYAPRRNADGLVDAVLALGMDVTDKVLAIQKAERSDAQMRLITDKLPAFISYTDNQGRYQFMNAMYENWFGKPISDMLGKTREEITPKDYSLQSRPYESKALGGSTSHHEGVIRKPSGEFLNLDINFVPDFDPVTKEVRGMVAVGVDISEQIRLLNEAELARRELHEVFMQAPAPMCLLTGPEYVFTMANPPYVEFVGREVQGKRLNDAFEGEDIQLYKKVIDSVYFGGEAYTITQAPLDIKDRSGDVRRRYVNVGYHPYKDANGKVKGVLVILLDVTEQVNSVIARDNFMGIASHELKTPITSLKLQAQLHQKVLEKEGMKAFDQTKVKKILKTVDTQVGRLSRLVDDMLDTSRIIADKLEMNFAEVDLPHLLTETVESFAPQFEEQEIEVQLELEEKFKIRADESRLEQVFTNLITNTIKYAPKAPLRIRMEALEDKVQISFQDQGPGIEPRYFDKIFERFERAGSGRDVSGLGIGLYISRKIVQNHQGRMWVESRPGAGATFVIELPKD